MLFYCAKINFVDQPLGDANCFLPLFPFFPPQEKRGEKEQRDQQQWSAVDSASLVTDSYRADVIQLLC